MTNKYRITHRLTLRIFLITSLLLITVCALTYGFIAYFMPLTYSSQLNTTLDQNVQQLIKELKHVTLVDSYNSMEKFTAANDAILTLTDESYYEIYVVNSNYNDSSVADSDVDVSADALAAGSAKDSPVTDLSIPMVADSMTGFDIMNVQMTQSYPVTFMDQSDPYILSVSGSMEAVNQAVAAMDQILPLLGFAILFISLLASFLYSRYITRPIVKLSHISSSMSDLEFDWHCDERRKDEIGILAHNLNQLSQSLSEALNRLKKANQSLKDDITKERELEQQRIAFFSAVSHELKTPITIIKGQIEGMLGNVGVYKDRDKYLSRSYSVACSLETMVAEILTISRMETSGFVLSNESFDFSQMITMQLKSYADLMELHTLELHAQIPDHLFCMGDRKLLQKVTSNLILNALKYTPANYPIYLKVQASPSGIGFSIENIGTHIPEEDLPHIMDAFYRVEQSRNRNTGGSGLGLYIVKMILDLHHAPYHIENTTAGVQFSFLIPSQE